MRCKLLLWIASAFLCDLCVKHPDPIPRELSLTKIRRKSKIRIIKIDMSFTKETAVERAKTDLADRLKIGGGEIAVESVADKDFPDMSLGTAVDGEMSAQMISSGWQIKLDTGGKQYEYRADKYQVRLHNFNGENYVIES